MVLVVLALILLTVWVFGYGAMRRRNPIVKDDTHKVLTYMGAGLLVLVVVLLAVTGD